MPEDDRFAEVEAAVAKMNDDLYRMTPSDPGLSLRLYRIEQLLQVMLKVGGVIAALGLAWKALEVWGEMIRKTSS